MLISEGYVVGFVLVVIVVISAALIGLFTREDTGEESIKPFILSDEERLSLESLTLELKKKAQQSKKLRHISARSKRAEGV